MNPSAWLLFLYAVPARHGTLRVGLWRKLKKMGAVPLKTSAYLLPDTPVLYERFQWLAKEITDAGGDATLVRTEKIEGQSERQLAALFNDARSEDYGSIIQALNALLKKNGRRMRDDFDAELEALRARFVEVQQIDFFATPSGQNAQMLFEKAEGLRGKKSAAQPRLNRASFQNKTWLTRPQPHIDRVGSAWLIKTFIDPKARFVFSAKPADFPDAIPYDMTDVEFTHQGDDCTFETLLKRFGLTEKPLQRVAEMVHDADLHDDKFHAHGAEGLDRIFRGLCRLGWTDDKILAHGFTCFDALHAQVKSA